MLVLKVEKRATLFNVIVDRLEAVVRTLLFIESTRSWARLDEACTEMRAAEEDVASVV